MRRAVLQVAPATVITASAAVVAPTSAVVEEPPAFQISHRTSADGTTTVWTIDGTDFELSGPAGAGMRPVSHEFAEKTDSAPGEATAVFGISPGTVAATAAKAHNLSWCASVDLSEDDVHARACTNRHYTRDKGRSERWADKGKMTAWSDDGKNGHDGCADCDNIEYARLYWDYRPNNTVTDWAPYRTDDIGSCQDYTASVSSPGGAGFSVGGTVCPDKIGPSGLSDTFFGAKWTTDDEVDVGDARGLVMSSFVKSPSDASDYTYMGLTVRWD
jgi:hypothetical protein